MCGVWAVAGIVDIRSHPMVWMTLFSTIPLYALVYDDLLSASGGGMGPVSKSAVQVAASSVLILQSGLSLERVTVPAVGQFEMGWVAVPATFLWLLYVTNIYNFMDGIDGLAGSQGLLIGMLLFGIALGHGSSDLVLLSGAVAGGSLGFLIFNRPPASIMMGDTGAGFLGFLLAAAALIAERDGMSSLTVPVLLGPFLFDASYTLVRRLLRRENIFRAHRSHLYQRLVRQGTSPARVDLLFVAALLPCGLSACLLNRGRPAGAGLAFGAFLLSGIGLAWWVERRWGLRPCDPGESEPGARVGRHSNPIL